MSGNPAPAPGQSRAGLGRGSLNWATISVLWRRDLLRFFRQKSRVAGALAQPLIFWLVLGSGLSGSFRAPGAESVGYLSYFYPGVIAMMILFASIFSTISVIEDRNEGFLQAVLVAPSSRAALAAGKIAGGATVALLQAALFLALAPAAGFPLAAVSWPLLAVLLALTALALTSLGFALAWWIDSTQGYHAVMSVLLIPLWVLSGAMFPVQGASPLLAALMRANPLTYAVDGIRRALHGHGSAAGVSLASATPMVEVLVAAVFAALAFGAAVLVCGSEGRRKRGGR